MQKNYPMKRNFGQFFPIFIDFGHQVRVCKKRSFLNIRCISKCMGININLGCRFEFTTQILPYERISGNFSDFINFGHHAKKKHFSILAVFQNVWDLHKFWVADLNSERKKLPYERISGNFFLFHRFWSSGPGMQKKVISQY